MFLTKGFLLIIIINTLGVFWPTWFLRIITKYFSEVITEERAKNSFRFSAKEHSSLPVIRCPILSITIQPTQSWNPQLLVRQVGASLACVAGVWNLWDCFQCCFTIMVVLWHSLNWPRENVKTLFYTDRFISPTVADSIAWDCLHATIYRPICYFFMSA